MTSILIVGAGPTGLNLALQLRRRGVAFRIIDRQPGPGLQSRALIVHARTLEFYAQIGLAADVVAAGTLIEGVKMREGGAEVAAFSLRAMGEGLSPFPFMLALPQDEHEALLAGRLATEGVTIEWNTRLDSLAQTDHAVDAVLDKGGSEENASFAYVAGCDGARSRVRETFGIPFEGGLYDRLYYVADVKPRERSSDGLVVALDKDDFALRLPARKGENERLIGYVPKAAETHPTFDDVRASAERLLGITVAEENWFSTYRVHHRVAARFRIGRCFLLGDAGHLHSPVGGQGMNTGIGDAMNLGWKLASVTLGRAPDALLDSYEPERIAFARNLVATTDRAFRFASAGGWVGAIYRSAVMPRLVPLVTRLAAGRRLLFRVLSQTRIAYRTSPLSDGRVGAIAAGDRLPWIKDLDNFAPLTSLDWQVHVFGDWSRLSHADGVPPVHAFAFTDAAREAGFAAGAAYLVRPDGHIALAMDRPDAGRIRDYARQRGLTFGDI